MSSPDSNANNSPDASDGSRAGLDPHEALARSPQVLQLLTALVDIQGSPRASNAGVSRLLQGIIDLVRHALAQPVDPASAAEPVSQQVLQVERGCLWSLECGPKGKQARHLPRPSIIGRALYDLQHEGASAYEGSKPADIYITISAKGPHHLSETASRYVTRYEAGETSNMSGMIGIHLEKRFEVLTKRIAGRIFAGRRGELRCLTGHGINLFADWPKWDARDDDLTGYGPSTSVPAPPAGGTSTT